MDHDTVRWIVVGFMIFCCVTVYNDERVEPWVASVINFFILVGYIATAILLMSRYI
jgi:hypothetical protein